MFNIFCECKYTRLHKGCRAHMSHPPIASDMQTVHQKPHIKKYWPNWCSSSLVAAEQSHCNGHHNTIHLADLPWAYHALPVRHTFTLVSESAWSIHGTAPNPDGNMCSNAEHNWHTPNVHYCNNKAACCKECINIASFLWAYSTAALPQTDLLYRANQVLTTGPASVHFCMIVHTTSDWITKQPTTCHWMKVWCINDTTLLHVDKTALLHKLSQLR